MREIKIEGNEVVFREVRGGTRGTDYSYIESGGELLPVKLVGDERFVEEMRGNRKKYEIRVDLARIRGGKIYNFSFSNSGGLFVISGDINTILSKRKSGGIGDIILSEERIRNLRFRILGEERDIGEEFERMRKDIKEVMRLKSFELLFLGHAERTIEMIKDPDMAFVTSMIFPNPNSRINSLKIKRRTLHEIWVMIHAIDALDAEVEGGKLLMETASEDPTGFLRSLYCDLTIWYQFPIWEQFMTVVRGAREGRRHHVRPDIVIFKGFYREASDLRTERGDMIREKAVVIDSKIEMREGDFEQLEAYTRLFLEGSKFICPCIKGVTRRTRRPNGWDVIEDVRPGGNGINRFRESLSEAVQEICSS